MNTTATPQEPEIRAGIQSAINKEVSRRVRSRVPVLLAFGVIIGALLGVVVAGDAMAASDPVSHGTKTMTAWAGSVFGLVCAVMAVKALAKGKMVELGVFICIAFLTVPFVFAPSTVQSLGKNVFTTVFGS